MTGAENNRISMFPGAPARETLRFLAAKLTVPEGPMICYIAGNFEAGNSLNLAVTAVVHQHSRETVHCYSLTS